MGFIFLKITNSFAIIYLQDLDTMFSGKTKHQIRPGRSNSARSFFTLKT